MPCQGLTFTAINYRLSKFDTVLVHVAFCCLPGISPLNVLFLVTVSNPGKVILRTAFMRPSLHLQMEQRFHHGIGCIVTGLSGPWLTGPVMDWMTRYLQNCTFSTGRERINWNHFDLILRIDKLM